MTDQPCGLPHYDYPFSRCTESAGHDGPHAAPLVIDASLPPCGGISWDAPSPTDQPETFHACPPDGSGRTPCCGRTPFELPRGDRISSETVTCAGRTPAPPDLREQYAAAIALYDHAVGQATDPAPSDHHYGQADAALAVRDRELEQLRAERDEMRQRFDNQAQAAGELIDERRQVEDRVRAELDALCREPHPSHDHVCPDDVRRSIRAALNPKEQPWPT